MSIFSRSMVSLPNTILHSWGYKTILLVSAVGYWLVSVFSDNILQYYPVGFRPGLRLQGNRDPIPHRLVLRAVASGLWVVYAGVEWYPNGHLEVNLFVGPTFFSVLLSFLFGLNMAVLAYLISTRYNRNSQTVLTVSLGAIPALFTSGMPCCSAPLGAFLISAFVPSAALITTSFTYGVITNSVVATAMLLSIFYTSRKVSTLSCSKPMVKPGLP